MEILIPVATTLATFCVLAGAAVWGNRRWKLEITPPPPPPRTPEERAWAKELGALQLEVRHPFCCGHRPGIRLS